MTGNPNSPRTQEPKGSVPDQKLVLPRQFDNVTKRRIRRDPKGFVTTLLGIEADEFQVIETEQLSMKTHLADSFIRVTMGSEQAIVHCEFQTHDSRDVPMPFRMAGYIGSAIAFYKLPIYSHVVYLHPTAGRTDPGLYVQEVSGYNIGIQYRVLRLTEMEGQALLDTNRVGLVPFAALMKPPASLEAPEWIRHCARAIEAGTKDESQQKEMLADLAILGGLAYDSQTIREAISEVIVQESSIIQYFTEQGIEQGKKQYAVEAILTVLEVRFQTDVAEKLKPFLGAIDDLQRLDQLHRIAAQASDIDEFTHALLNLENQAAPKV